MPLRAVVSRKRSLPSFFVAYETAEYTAIDRAPLGRRQTLTTCLPKKADFGAQGAAHVSSVPKGRAIPAPLSSFVPGRSAFRWIAAPEPTPAEDSAGAGGPPIGKAQRLAAKKLDEIRHAQPA